jgi:hypothetical protein
VAGTIGGGRQWRVSMISGVDAVEVDRRYAEVAAAELALDDVDWDALAGELNRVCVA